MHYIRKYLLIYVWLEKEKEKEKECITSSRILKKAAGTPLKYRITIEHTLCAYQFEDSYFLRE